MEHGGPCHVHMLCACKVDESQPLEPHGSGPMGSKWRGTWEWSNGEQVEGHMGVVQWGVSGGAHGSGPMGSKWRGTWEWSNGEQVEGHMGVVQWGVSGGAHGSGPMGSKWRGTWEWSNGE